MDKKQIKKNYKTKKRELKRSYRKKKEALTDEYLYELECERVSHGKRPPINPPKRHFLEEIGNSVTHCVGAVFAVVAFALMLVRSHTVEQYVGAALYFFGLFVMFTVSCLYHAFPYGSAVKRLFRRFDYSCIYLLIGATFAPILISYVGGSFGVAFLVAQWAVIATGITLVAVFGPGRLRFIHIPLYVILGWCGLVFIPEMIRNGDYAFLGFILGGGIIYSVGIIPFAINAKISHFIWHFFVLAGAIVQWVGVYIQIYP